MTDFTLRGLCAELAERGSTVDYRTMWSFVHDATQAMTPPLFSTRFMEVIGLAIDQG